MTVLKVSFCVVYLILISTTFASKQRVVISGTLMCGDKPYEGATVKLVDKDVVKDDLMGEMKTGKDGTFWLDGTENEVTGIDAVLKIYHDCDDTLLGVPVPCQRRWVFKLPKKAVIPPGGKDPKPFDLGTWNLEMRMRDEEHDFIDSIEGPNVMHTFEYRNHFTTLKTDQIALFRVQHNSIQEVIKKSNVYMKFDKQYN